MPHQSYEINTLADYSSAISNFIASNPNCPWSLEPITQDGVFTVMHKLSLGRFYFDLWIERATGEEC
ncbi:hypothetical protein DK293_11555, partial [Vibrio cholerae]|nr:hypothetical protein [Vibrio cholerae]